MTVLGWSDNLWPGVEPVVSSKIWENELENILSWSQMKWILEDTSTQTLKIVKLCVQMKAYPLGTKLWKNV